MNSITIPYHLVFPTILAFIGLVICFAKREKLFITRERKVVWISLTVFLASYLLIVGSATFYDIYYQVELNRYDLDKDGFFAGKEITTEQIAAELRLTNDVGRNLSFITGLIFSLIISLGTYVVGRFIGKKRLLRNPDKEIW